MWWLSIFAILITEKYCKAVCSWMAHHCRSQCPSSALSSRALLRLALTSGPPVSLDEVRKWSFFPPPYHIQWDLERWSGPKAWPLQSQRAWRQRWRSSSRESSSAPCPPSWTRAQPPCPRHTVHFWPKKMGKSGEGSSRVVISQPQWQLLSKAYNNVFLAAPSPMFPKRNRHPYPKSPDDRSNKVTCKCIEFLIDSVDVTLVYEDDLQLQGRMRWFWQLWVLKEEHSPRLLILNGLLWSSEKWKCCEIFSCTPFTNDWGPAFVPSPNTFHLLSIFDRL